MFMLPRENHRHSLQYNFARLAALFILSMALTPHLTYALDTPERWLRTALAQTCATTSQIPCGLLQAERRELGDGVAHYRFDLDVGEAPIGLLRLHRVVRERAPGVPSRTRQGVFLAHGDRWGFEATFLTGLGTDPVPGSHALPIFLAQNDLDVWGLDFRWALVPEDTADLSSFADYGLGADVQDLGLALDIARRARRVSGGDGRALHLAGFSRGGQAGYAHLSAATQQPQGRRSVRGFIALDIALTSADPVIREAACGRVEGLRDTLATGQVSASTTIFRLLGELASAAPEEPSPLFPPFTNRELAIDAVGFPRPSGISPFFHGVGTIYTEDFFPLGLRFSEEERVFAFLRGQAVHQPLRGILDGDIALCGAEDSPFDDHLADIEVPVLYVGAGGGFGDNGVAQLDALGSADVSHLVVRALPIVDLAFDLGHNEIFLAEDAESLFWRPILEWIKAHR